MDGQSLFSDDSITTVADLKSIVDRFVSERDWQQFHSPKNLATSISIESAELCEHFQWLTNAESIAILSSPEKLQPIAEELADVLSYVIALANVTGIDLAEALQAKMLKNAIKYPKPD